MKHPKITRDIVKTCFESKYMNVYDIQHAEGKHYYSASRRKLDDTLFLKSDEEILNMKAEAVNCAVIVNVKGMEPQLFMNREFRYPIGQFVWNPPAGLIDQKDYESGNAVLEAARREIKEETGLTVKESDRIFIANPGVFSSPGFTDETNAIVCAVIDVEDESEMNHDGAEGSECFEGYVLLNKEEALKVVREGKDDNGIMLSVYTYICLLYFVSDMWK